MKPRFALLYSKLSMKSYAKLQCEESRYMEILLYFTSYST